ncbi:hypothetical protein IJ818_08100 [bacterium]|nr:hypothetical protein [bacterium]
MGKALKRGMNKSKNNLFESLSRDEAINKVVKGLKNNTNRNDNIEDLITLFGLSSEELLENGASYEEVKSVSGFLND